VVEPDRPKEARLPQLHAPDPTNNEAEHVLSMGTYTNIYTTHFYTHIHTAGCRDQYRQKYRIHANTNSTTASASVLLWLIRMKVH